MLVVLAAVVLAADEPYGPSAIGRVSDERANFSGIAAQQIQAQAGNVTQLTINASIISTRWQGYYGNISGTITLDDGSGNTMFDWGSGAGFAPIGEIYAANNTISNWSDIICVNFMSDGVPGQGGINDSVLETMYGMGATDVDGINETFSSTENVGVGLLTLSGCPATNTYVNNASQSASFNETLLTENSTGTVIFATEVSQDTVGFDGNPWDFQMIVGENGNVSATTPYSFYVELA